jgi:predicted nucleic acid-binding protein
MDRLYLDANVILDYLQTRPNAEFVEKILLMGHNNQVSLITSVLNFATIFYIEKRRDHSTKKILSRFKLMNKVITPVDQTVQSYHAALNSNFTDFEDALQYFAAMESGSNFIITGNKKDFKHAVIPVLSSKEYINRNF